MSVNEEPEILMGKKVIIIGGGVAGLSAGIYGQMNGYDTEILEMHTGPGGQCTAWKRMGYTFDHCIHWLVGTSHGPFHQIWRETGALDDTTRVIDPETYVTIMTTKGEALVIYSDVDRWERYLLEIAPEDESAIRRMCRDMRRAATLEISGKPPFRRNLFDTIRFLFKSGPALKIFVRYSRMTVGDYFHQLGFRSDVLKERLVGFASIMEDFSAIAFIMTLSWFSNKNAGYPVGGSMPFTLRMFDRYQSLGGTFTGGAKVERIITGGGKATGVRLKDGTEKYADHIIGACDLHALIYDLLEGKHLTPEIDKAFTEWPLFKSMVQVSFGIDRPIESGDHTYHVMAEGSSIGSTVLTAGYSIANYNHDPMITPEGKCVMKLCYDSPFEIWERMDQAEYRAEKEKIREDATELLERFYPDVKGHLDVVDVATPLTDVKYTGVWKGAYEGFMPAISSIGKAMKMTINGLENFYLAGQWTYPGGGLPPSAQSGKWVVEAICRKDRKKFRVDSIK
jgi:phytoene desaturase